MAFDTVTFFELHLDTPTFGGASEPTDDTTDREMDTTRPIAVDEMDVDTEPELVEPRSGGSRRIAVLATVVGAIATVTLARRLASRRSEPVDEIEDDDVDRIDVDFEAPVEQ
jgi:hypothetical protein